MTVRKVEILCFPDVQLLDVAGPLQALSSANEQLGRQGRASSYVMRVVAPKPDIRATAGLSFATDALSGTDDPVDTLIVAGGQGVMRAAEDTDLVSWVATRARASRRVAAVCTGAFLLGAAGLLDGRRAVTHWEYCERLARRFPLAKVEPDRIFIRDGHVWTSAGVTAGIDLTLALVEEDLGHALALAVAQHLVMFLKRPGGQAQFSAMLTLQASDDRFPNLHAWIREHLSTELSLPRLAEQVGMSERSFSRKYREQTGITPAQAVKRIRIEVARQLVVETELPLKRIADRCGFGTEETLRRAFHETFGSAPSDYRHRFSD
ncbi:GlxA family transcriptional regulator [Arenibaculum pallidiluteum]|uniref:GlxA family transcriptional regulator n=1 Tax=Arenibaculum pallidiluteum TaxID=2812559 RepID=UPI001A95E1BF|nr:GlxA family transcriptional regulator [Arenibaculum pallidiluteum]